MNYNWYTWHPSGVAEDHGSHLCGIDMPEGVDPEDIIQAKLRIHLTSYKEGVTDIPSYKAKEYIWRDIGDSTIACWRFQDGRVWEHEPPTENKLIDFLVQEKP